MTAPVRSGPPLAAIASVTVPVPLRVTPEATVIQATSLAALHAQPSGAVTLTDAQNAKAEATTDASGRFQLPAVAGGRYVLEAKAMGFNAFRQELELTNAGDWDRAITLQVGKLGTQRPGKKS